MTPNIVRDVRDVVEWLCLRVPFFRRLALRFGCGRLDRINRDAMTIKRDMATIEFDMMNAAVISTKKLNSRLFVVNERIDFLLAELREHPNSEVIIQELHALTDEHKKLSYQMREHSSS